MGHVIIMLALAIIVASAMVATLWWFFQRLAAIESQRVGPKK